jgi:hypothetical protein
MLDFIRRQIGPPPRPAASLDWAYLEMLLPPLFPRDDPLGQFYRHQKMLWREGVVAWGAIVQANNALFEPGFRDMPATMIVSTDPALEAGPQRLIDVARHLGTLKGTRPFDPVERRYAEMLTSEIDRGMGLKVPYAYRDGLAVWSTTVMFCRKHLPRGVLSEPAYPVLSLYPETACVYVIPPRYWPAEFLARCQDAASAFVELYDEDLSVVLSTEAANAVRELSRQHGPGQQIYLRIGINVPIGHLGSASPILDLDPVFDPAQDVLLESRGIPIVMERALVDALPALTIRVDFMQDGNGRLGFAVDW